MLIKILKLTVATCVLATGLLAQQGGGEDQPNTRQSISFYLENDMFAQSDRYYTNGTRLSWLSQDLESMALPAWAQWVLNQTPYLRRPGYTNNIGFAIGQGLFTPEDIMQEAVVADDVPYAGWLYADVSLHHKSVRHLHVVALTLGVIGPEALGEETHETVHRLRSLDVAEGWDNQLSTEPGVMLSYEYRRRYPRLWETSRFGVDFIPAVRLNLGNVLTQVAVGGTMRAGLNLPTDFHSNLIRASGYAIPEPERRHDGTREISVYFFAGVDGKAVAHNVFLDGNTFTDSHSVDREIFVGEFSSGIGVRWRRWRFHYSQVFRTQEFEEQDKGHQFGSINVAYSF